MNFNSNFKLCLVTLLCFFVLSSAVAQTDFWQQTTYPFADTIYSLQADKRSDYLFAGSSSHGVVRSTDHGMTWTETNQGLNSHTVRAIALGSIPGELFVGTSSGVYYTTDDGNSWTRRGLGGYTIVGLAEDTQGSFLLAGTMLWGGIFRSIDKGLSWVASNTGLRSDLIEEIVITQSGNVVASAWTSSTDTGGVYVSTDDGLSWNITFGSGDNYNDLAVDDLNGYVYVVRDGNSGYRSSDNGLSWPLQLLPKISWLTDVVVNETNGHVFISGNHRLSPTGPAGVSRSTNSGVAWQKINSGLTDTTVESLTIDKEGYLFAGGKGWGIYRSIQTTSSNCLSGHVTDALTGQPIEGATVTVGGLSTTTGSDGAYIICNIPTGTLTAAFTGHPTSGSAPLDVQFTDQSTEGTHIVTCSQEGYVTYSNNQVTIPPNTLDISLSPTLPTGQMRLVLNWGADPRDLDAHLLTPSIGGTPYHVWYLDLGDATSPPYATLDHDDTTSYGPETITIVEFFAGTYHYYVHNYSGEHSGDTSLTQSHAVVQIYTDEGLIRTVYVPTTGTGLYWHVCDINGLTKAVTIVNQIISDPPTGLIANAAVTKIGKIQKHSKASGLAKSTSSITWEWDLGDGKTSTLQHPMHTYQQAGSYTVTLTVNDGTTTNTETKTDYITISPWTLQYSVLEGWNMVSVALSVDDYTKTILYPTAISDAFAYEGSYIPKVTLMNGIGYWVKFDGDQNVSMSGYMRTRDTIAVRSGWNMIGSISEPTQTDSITSIPSGITTSNFFGYDGNNYSITDTIYPGKGYWVKVPQACSLILSKPGSFVMNKNSSSHIHIVPTSDYPPLPPSGELSSVVLIPETFSLYQNYPNPFNPSTSIRYGIPEESNVTISVYNTLGQRVALLVDENQEVGYHEVAFDGAGLPSGVYFYRLQAGDPSSGKVYTEMKKLLLMK